MKYNKNISLERVRCAFNYNPITGDFTWGIIKSYKTGVGDTAGRLNHDGYFRVAIDGHQYMAHRLIWLYVYGEWPDGEIDHINGMPSDNRIINLRSVSHQENSINKKLISTSTSGIAGICWNKSNSNWRVRINTDHYRENLGSYKDFFEACCARKSAERKYGYHANHGLARIRPERVLDSIAAR